MSGRGTLTRRSRPLTTSELTEARAAAERLAVEVTRLLAGVEPQHRNAFALARFLGADRTACQRLLSAVTTVDEWTVARAPGVKTLRRFAATLEERGIEASIVRGFREATTRLERLFADTAGHQRAFAERLLLSQQRAGAANGAADVGWESSAPHEAAGAARRLFDAACQITGRWSDVQLRLAVIRPSPDQKGACDLIRARGHIGHVQTPGAIPLTLMHTYSAANDGRAYAELRPRAREAGEVPTFMLDEYCSPNWRVSNFIEGKMLIQSIEADPRAVGQPGDIVLGTASYGSASDPRFDSPPIQEVWVQFEYPSRHLVMDVYLHKDLARGVTSGGDVHALRTHDAAEMKQVHLRWMTRIGQPIPLALLGTGIDGADCAAYPRQRELTRTLFESTGWEAGEFVGFRLEIPFPMWRTSARVYFNMPGA
jgi:hypothetical protein